MPDSVDDLLPRDLIGDIKDVVVLVWAVLWVLPYALLWLISRPFRG